jgi:hypothetical protein
MAAAIVAVGQSAYVRHPSPEQSTHTFIRDAVIALLADAGIRRRQKRVPVLRQGHLKTTASMFPQKW